MQTSQLLLIMLIVVFCWGFQQVLGRGYYAQLDTVTPALIGTCCHPVSIPVYYFFTLHFQVVGVALASSISVGLYTGFLGLWWRHRFGKDAFLGLGKDFLKVVAALSACGIACRARGQIQAHRRRVHPYGEALYAIGLSGMCFSVIFVVLSSYFIPDLIRPVLQKTGPLGRLLLR